MTNLGPLPTDFAIASNCANDLNDIYKINTSPQGYYYLLQGPVEQTSCYPSSYTANTQQFYSPALCPTGFTSACKALNRIGTVQETILTCCPTQAEYVCQTTNNYEWEKTLGCVFHQISGARTTWTVSEVSDAHTSLVTSEGTAGGLNAYSIQVRYQSTDFVSSTSSSSSSSSTKSDTNSKTSVPSATNTQINSSSSNNNNNGNGKTNHKSNGSLSAGAAAGIAIAAFAALLIAVAGIWFLVRKRKQQQQQQQQQAPQQEAMHPYGVPPMQQPQQPHYQGSPPPESMMAAGTGTPMSWASGAAPIPHQPQPPHQYYDPPKPADAPAPVFHEMGAHENAVEMDGGGVPPAGMDHRYR
ncbi:hypothetical protein F5Y19DRAFT_160819 [Xylariaceae sp. FL1651]|nr:hypothetical protein F5Y19DRAFT_160819 [Xylariaceae sp. FL1651]